MDDFRRKAAIYEKPQRYYNGDHDLRFATEKFENTFGSLFREFALNLCPVVCDAVRDKLRITGFDGHGKLTPEGVELAGSIWNRNRMRLRSGEVHKEVLKCGDAYVIVWPDAAGRAVIHPNRASQIAVEYDDESPGRITSAAKYWFTRDKFVRLNLFYPDRIEKYISKEKCEGTLPEAKEFVEFGERPSPIANPFGVVPVFHFANNADLGSMGRSELEAAIPLQDGLNKSVLDMLVAMEFSAFRQRWAAGIEVDYDANGKAIQPYTAGVEKLWVAGDANARFGDFDAAELEQFLKVKDSFRVDVASVTGTPLHYFLQQAGEFASGESLRRSETRFLAKVRDRQEAFGQVWADIMALALRIEGANGIDLATEWEDPSPMTERERLENLLLKARIDGHSRTRKATA